MGKSVSGMLVSIVVTVVALAGVATTIEKVVIDPVEGKEDMIEESRKKVMRKRIARQKITATLR